jgi:hypothetical protein
VTTVINVPPSLDDYTFEQVLDQIAPVPPDARILVDARHARWASPYGLTALLCLAQSRAERPALAAPDNDDTASYWARAGFFRHAEELYELHGHVPRPRGGDSNVLLEITPVMGSQDVHEVVGRIQQKAQHILSHELNIDAKATVGFAMTLSEICQNIVEHAGVHVGKAPRQARGRDRGVRRRRRISAVAREPAGPHPRHSVGRRRRARRSGNSRGKSIPRAGAWTGACWCATLRGALGR